MLPQGVLGFQYEAERSRGGLTSLAGLPLYLDLVHHAVGLAAQSGVTSRLPAAGQGCVGRPDGAGGGFPEPGRLAAALRTLSGCSSVTAGLRRQCCKEIERDLLSRAEAAVVEAALAARARARTVPSPSALWPQRGWGVSMTPPHRRRFAARRSFRR